MARLPSLEDLNLFGEECDRAEFALLLFSMANPKLSGAEAKAIATRIPELIKNTTEKHAKKVLFNLVCQYGDEIPTLAIILAVLNSTFSNDEWAMKSRILVLHHRIIQSTKSQFEPSKLKLLDCE